jgi:hypothetical protein
LSWPGGVAFGAVAGAGSDAAGARLTGAEGFRRPVGALELGAFELGALA